MTVPFVGGGSDSVGGGSDSVGGVSDSAICGWKQ